MEPVGLDAQFSAANAFASGGAPDFSGVDSAAAAERTAKEFEGFFISQMLQAMFAGVKTPEPFGGGPGEDSFRGLLIEEYGKQLSANGGIGLAAPLKAEIMRLQGL